MDLGLKSTSELYLLSHHANTLIDELRGVDDTEEIRAELGALSESIDYEMSHRPARMLKLHRAACSSPSWARGWWLVTPARREGSKPPSDPPIYPDGGWHHV
jgi:hypothetical protein